MPFTEHLVELRRRIIAVLIIWGAGSALALNIPTKCLDWLARPVGQLVLSRRLRHFIRGFKLALYGGFLLTFLCCCTRSGSSRPALDRRWRRRLLTMVPLSYGLFILE